MDRADNLLVFGLPGRGKRTLWPPLATNWSTSAAVSSSPRPTAWWIACCAAKRDLLLEHELRRLDRFEVLILDDIGYVQQSPEEMEVLFTLLAERYERRSVVITSNLVFSQWDQIFKNPMTTAAAIDRVVHHSIIVEFGKEMSSHRADEAAKRLQETPLKCPLPCCHGTSPAKAGRLLPPPPSRFAQYAAPTALRQGGKTQTAPLDGARVRGLFCAAGRLQQSPAIEKGIRLYAFCYGHF